MQVLDIIKYEASVPVFTIGGLEIPLYGIMDLPVWALVNLFLSIVGLFLAAITVSRARRRRRFATDRDSDRLKLVVLLTAAIAAMAGIILFLFTEDISNLMVIVDAWTIVHLLILLIVVASMVVSTMVGKTKRQPRQEFIPKALPAD